MTNDQVHVLDILVEIYPSDDLHTFACTCQCVYPSQNDVLTRRIFPLFLAVTNMVSICSSSFFNMIFLQHFYIFPPIYMHPNTLPF